MATHLTRLRYYAQLMRLNKPIGSFLLLWPTFWALCIAAKGIPSLKLSLIFALGVYLMRAAGCVINDYADRNLDGFVKRTKERPLAAGKLSTREALGLFGFLGFFAFLLVLQTNPMTLGLALVGLILAIIYPFCKRFTQLPQLVLGMTWSLGILMSFTATSSTLPAVAFVLYLAHTVMTVAYDSLYAMVDRDDDLKVGIKSTAILMGKHDKLAIGLLQIVFIGLMLVAGQLAALNLAYYLGLGVASLLLIYQQWLIRHRQRQLCFQAFLNNNWVGLVILLGIVGAYLSA